MQRSLLIVLGCLAAVLAVWLCMPRGEGPNQIPEAQRLESPVILEVASPAVELGEPGQGSLGAKRSSLPDGLGLDAGTPEAAPKAESPLELLPGCRLRARVLDLAGAPIVDELIQLELCSPGESRPNGRLFFSQSNALGQLVFQLDAIAEYIGPQALMLQTRELDAFGWSAGDFVIPEGELDIGDVFLSEPKQRFPVPLVTGWVRDDSGEPVPNVFGLSGHGSDAAQSENPESDAESPRRRWIGQVEIDSEGAFVVHGPPEASYLDLTFLAPGFQNTTLFQLPVPATNIEVTLHRELSWTGRLVVPEAGPAVQEYAVWMRQAGQMVGMLVESDGRFEAIGSSLSTEFLVSQPTLGSVLFKSTLEYSSESGGDVGLIDLRGRLKFIDLAVEDSGGEPQCSQTLILGMPPGFDCIANQLETDAEGRLRAAFLLETPWIELQAQEGQALRVDLITPPSVVTLP